MQTTNDVAAFIALKYNLDLINKELIEQLPEKIIIEFYNYVIGWPDLETEGKKETIITVFCSLIPTANHHKSFIKKLKELLIEYHSNE